VTLAGVLAVATLPPLVMPAAVMGTLMVAAAIINS
jgi:hypothetical protein